MRNSGLVALRVVEARFAVRLWFRFVALVVCSVFSGSGLIMNIKIEQPRARAA